jgi:hypothetical protein
VMVIYCRLLAIVVGTVARLWRGLFVHGAGLECPLSAAISVGRCNTLS